MSVLYTMAVYIGCHNLNVFSWSSRGFAWSDERETPVIMGIDIGGTKIAAVAAKDGSR